jgi:hypothetical protein
LNSCHFGLKNRNQTCGYIMCGYIWPPIALIQLWAVPILMTVFSRLTGNIQGVVNKIREITIFLISLHAARADTCAQHDICSAACKLYYYEPSSNLRHIVQLCKNLSSAQIWASFFDFSDLGFRFLLPQIWPGL